MKIRPGEPMTEENKKEWEKAFMDIEESISKIDDEGENEKKNPYAKYKKLKQQDLF